MRVFMERLRVSWYLVKDVAVHFNEIEFHGACQCGCGKWFITIPSVKGMVPLKESTYRRILRAHSL